MRGKLQADSWGRGKKISWGRGSHKVESYNVIKWEPAYALESYGEAREGDCGLANLRLEFELGVLLFAPLYLLSNKLTN